MYTSSKIYGHVSGGRCEDEPRQLTTLVPRLILRDSASAFLLSLKEAWKAVW